jgi:primosomal protein N''
LENKEALLKLQVFLKSLYQKAIDADHKLSAIKKEGRANFKVLIDEPSLFATQSDHFKPYVLEIAESMHALETDGGSESELTLIVKRMQAISTLLDAFSQVLKPAPAC